MTERHDPEVRALVFELAQASPTAPVLDLEKAPATGRRGTKQRGEIVMVDGSDFGSAPRRQMPGPVLAIAAAAIVLAAAGGVLLLTNWPEGEVAVTTTATTAPLPTSTIASTTTLTTAAVTTAAATSTSAAEIVLPATTPLEPAPESAATTWERISSPAFAQATPEAFVTGVSGLVGLGPDGAIWTSSDGRGWTVSADPALAAGRVTDVAVWGQGFVAVGSVEHREPGLSPVLHGAVWLSDDGITWTRVPDQDSLVGGDFVPPGGVGISAVTAGGPGLVAVGNYDRDGFHPHAAVWLSADGLTWARVDPAAIEGEGNPEGDGPGAMMRDVTAGGPGLVAVGEVGTYQWQAVPAVWLSEDGAAWEQVLLDAGVQGQTGFSSADAVAAGPAGIAVVGHIGDRQDFGASGMFGIGIHAYAGVWLSEDGRDWRLAGVLHAADIETSTCHYREGAGGALWSGDVLLVAGSAVTTCLTKDVYQIVWSTADMGGSWHELAKLPNPLSERDTLAIARLAQLGPRVVLIGDGAVWLGTGQQG